MKSRRDVIKGGLIGLGLVGLGQIVGVNPALARRKRKGGDTGGGNLVEPGKGMAANVNYQHDKAKITDASLKKAKNGTDYKDQYCSNCVLYAAGKDGKGKCSLFPGKLVAEKGWCTSWSLKS